ncbi:rho GTPase-activating protein 28 isoform X2 [Seriola aureovittata]|uniref:rho GTPase-activating protein 28 isoform X2 n=1 Tax=Seriola aureovittata TaxID=2871759 RepID=UPI0024BF0209|nr:rho GTPase-activating protein 28 isoform X2 [Seriola aureovittata]
MLSCPPTTSPSPSPPPPTNTMTSDPHRAAMETYWREVQSIEEEKEGEDEDEEEEERKSMDGKSNLQQSETSPPCLTSTCLCLPAEVELEEVWLTEAGLSSLVTGSSEDEAPPPPAEAVLSTLTRQQTATVRRRLDIYNETLKKRNKQPIRDVRDIFTQSDNDSADRCPSPFSHHSASPPSRYHTTTKTIRRSTHRVRSTLPTFLFEDQLPEHPSSPTNTHSPSNTHSLTLTPSPPHTHSPPVSQSRRADWLLRDSPYSEGVAEHKRGGTCWDCLHFIEDDNSDLSFVPVCPSQDLTCADDLSSCDLTQLCFISHIELSTFLVALGVQIKHTRPPRRRTQDGGVFGVPLNSLLENDRKRFPGIKVPVVFQKLLCILEQTGLQTEGILRVPGSAARLKYLRRELDRCGGDLDWSAVRQVDAAGLLKLFIRELPTPLLTHTHLSTYRSVLGVSSVLHQVQALQLLSLLLPEVNRDTLRALLVFLRKVVSHQDQNRMSLWNVSMVMAPNLFSCHHHGNKLSITKQREEMEEAVGGAQLIRLMITHQDLLWIVPSFLLSQVRRMNQATNQKQSGLTRTGRRLLRRKSDKNDRNQITELCEGVIRVCAPLHTKVSMAIQLDGQMRAKDVTARFEFENSPVQSLYEVGGNICERRLHPDCILLDVYRANPHCDWLIKP